MIAVAYKINGESFLEGLFKFAQSQPRDFPITKFLDEMNKIINKIPQEEKQFDLRLYENESNFHVLNF
jgi:hypothetical protein